MRRCRRGWKRAGGRKIGPRSVRRSSTPNFGRSSVTMPSCWPYVSALHAPVHRQCSVDDGGVEMPETHPTFPVTLLEEAYVHAPTRPLAPRGGEPGRPAAPGADTRRWPPRQRPVPTRTSRSEEGLKLTYRAGRSGVLILTRDVQPRRRTAAQGHGGGEHRRTATASTEATCTAEGVTTGLGGLEGTLLSASGMDVEVVSARAWPCRRPRTMVPGRHAGRTRSP